MKLDTRVSGPVEVGTLGTWAKKLKEVNMPEILSKKRVRDLLVDRPEMWRSVRALKDLRSEVQPRRDKLTAGVLFCGKTGTGKTKLASLISSYLGADETYWKPVGKWWNGYDQEQLVVYDEFRGQCEVSELLKLLDRTPHQIEFKGGVGQFNSNMIIFCSNIMLEHMYPDMDFATLEAIRRRFLVINFS